MTTPAGPRAAAVHIGADVLAHPRHARWARPLSCRDTAERLWRVCQAAGIGAQQTLLGRDATTGRARAAIAASAAATGPGGVLVVTFSGHSERPVPGEHGGGWCLHDQVLRHAETAGLVAAAPASAHIVIIADTCYAAACAAAFAGVPATTVVLAACAENQATLNYRQSQFVKALERLTYPGGRPNPDCGSYAWLRRELRKDTPDVERPDVRASNPAAMRQRPFQPTPQRSQASADGGEHRSAPDPPCSCCSQAGDRDVVNAETRKAGRAARAGGEGTRRRGP